MPGKWHAGTLNFLDVSPLSLLLWLLHEAARSSVRLFPFLIFYLFCCEARVAVTPLLHTDMGHCQPGLLITARALLCGRRTSPSGWWGLTGPGRWEP